MNGVRIWLAWEVFGLGSDTERETFLENVDAAAGWAGGEFTSRWTAYVRPHHGIINDYL